MKLDDLLNKEIVNISDGKRMGIFYDVDMIINPKNGKIKSFLIPESRSGFGFFSDRTMIEIPWDKIKKIGDDMIIVELVPLETDDLTIM